MHPDRRKSPEEAQAVWDRARSVHADSILPNATAVTYKTKPFRYFIVSMSVAFIITTLLGLVLAFRFTKKKLIMWGCFLFGFVVPVALLLLAQKK
jgi:hypothetical protein